MQSLSFQISNCTSMASNPAPTRVILVRHGRSTFNEQGRYQGSSDESVLTEQGQQTAYQVGQALRNINIDVVYASPLKRVQQTVDGIIQARENASRLPVHWTRQLREIDLPRWEGLPFKVVREQLKSEYRCWKERPHEFQMETAVDINYPAALRFPVLDLYERAAQFWHETLHRHRGKVVLIVSHGGTNHALISTALNIAPAHYHTLQQSNCGISVLEFPNGKLESATIRSLNLTHFLGEPLPKLKEGKQGLRLLLVPTVNEAHQIELAEKLRSLPIDFCLNTDAEDAQSTTHAVLQHHPQAIQLHTTCNNFPQLWQQSINNQQNHSPHVLTGLVVSDVQSIQDIVGQAIGLDSDQRWRLQLQPGAVSIVHYPAVDHHPVLQALNFGGAILTGQTESEANSCLNSSPQLDLTTCTNAA